MLQIILNKESSVSLPGLLGAEKQYENKGLPLFYADEDKIAVFGGTAIIKQHAEQCDHWKVDILPV